ncbi:MAG: DUF3017 domain-containing protein [Nocardioides sp.]
MTEEPTLDPPGDVPPVSAERLVDGRLVDDDPDEDAPAPAASDDVRRYPSTIGGAFYLLVLAASMVGMVIVVVGSWRTGVRWVATALVLGSLVRLVLPSRDAGMLAVRSKWLDALMISGVGAALFFLAETIPNQPGS